MRTLRTPHTILGLLAAIVAFAPSWAADPTIGAFIQRLAERKGVPASDPATAVESLAARGVRLPPDLRLSSTLTEGDVVAISAAFGLRLSSSRPAARFDARTLDRFFDTFGDEVGGDSRSGEGPPSDPPDDAPPFDPFSKAKGKGKGGDVTPTEPG